MDEYSEAVKKIDEATKNSQVLGICQYSFKIYDMPGNLTRLVIQSILDQMNAQSLVLAQVLSTHLQTNPTENNFFIIFCRRLPQSMA